ncbi:MAG: hypothetical protein MUC40_10185, partial [Akkermansiaceae bacterium]|nr:hypothetical protein [Akkermansiaceae bacterium]
MSDSENNPLNDLLSSFALGPSWARATGTGQEKRADKPDARSGDRPPRREERRDDGRKGGFRERDGERRPQRGPRSGGDDRYGGPPRHEEAPPAEGVRVILIPDAQAVHLIGKEVHQVARVYPLFDVAKILLAERGRCRAVFETAEPHPPLLRGKLDDSVFLTREEYEALAAEARTRPATAPPQAVVLLSADYDAVVRENLAVVRGRLQLDVLEPGVHAVPLPWEGLAVRAAQLDGVSAPLARSPQGVVLFVRDVGRHRLEVECQAPVVIAAAQQSLQVRLPAAGSATLRLAVPGNVEVK